MKYIQKLMVVDAEQWSPDVEVAGVKYEQGRRYGTFRPGGDGDPIMVYPGDYVITYSDGVREHVRENVFLRMYEPQAD